MSLSIYSYHLFSTRFNRCCQQFDIKSLHVLRYQFSTFYTLYIMRFIKNGKWRRRGVESSQNLGGHIACDWKLLNFGYIWLTKNLILTRKFLKSFTFFFLYYAVHKKNWEMEGFMLLLASFWQLFVCLFFQEATQSLI